MSADTRDRLEPVDADVRRIDGRHKLALGGGGVAEGTVRGAIVLAGDPVAAADRLMELLGEDR